jgi:hypothetical protein
MAAGKKKEHALLYWPTLIGRHYKLTSFGNIWGIYKLLQAFRRTNGLNYVSQQFTDSVRLFLPELENYYYYYIVCPTNYI